VNFFFITCVLPAVRVQLSEDGSAIILMKELD